MVEPQRLPWKKPKDPVKALIDELGEIRAHKSREKEIKELLLKSLGDGEHSGDKYVAVISTKDREGFNEREFKANHPELAARYTESKPVTSVQIKRAR